MRDYFLVYSSLISIVHLVFLIRLKMCSKHGTGCFVVYYPTFLIQKNVWLKQAGTCFLVYWATFLIWTMRVQNKGRAAFQFIKLLFVMQKNTFSKQAVGCFPVYWITFSNKKNACSERCFLDNSVSFVIRKRVFCGRLLFSLYVTCCRKKDHPLLRFQPRFDVSNLV